ncbi:MAG TPA: adhesin [Micromonosporaceae bacterium]|jgi:Fe-S cluster assembly iron-binding protein IscA
MINLTNNAVTAIHNLTGQPNMPAGCGLRLASDPDRGAWTLSLAAEPIEGDAVVESAGARLFVDPDAAVVLTDKTIDAEMDTEGQLNFTIAEDGPTEY